MSKQTGKSLSDQHRVIILVSLSGAGGRTALKTLADLGFFTIDNLPVPFFSDFLKLSQSNQQYSQTALLLDLRNPIVVTHIVTLLKDIKSSQIELIFFDATNEVILKRYSETRRPHPLFNPAQDKTLLDAIQRERALLTGFKEIANLAIDTSNLNVHELRRQLEAFCQKSYDKSKIFRVQLISFGFKHGSPIDCELLMDVRFMTNPHFVENLRSKSGKEPEVKSFVLDHPATKEFLARYTELLKFLIPQYEHEGKSYLNIAIGCTGGKHRSVVISEELAARIGGEGREISVLHRDLGRE